MQIGPFGLPELLAILAIALIIFGPRKLPELSRTLGRALGEFRKGSVDLRRSLEEEVRNLDGEIRDDTYPPPPSARGAATRDVEVPAEPVQADRQQDGTEPPEAPEAGPEDETGKPGGEAP